MYVVVVILSARGIGKPGWKRYSDKHGGRQDFQVDLAMALSNYTIMKEWDGHSKKPGWMRNCACVPCDCEECYFV